MVIGWLRNPVSGAEMCLYLAEIVSFGPWDDAGGFSLLIFILSFFTFLCRPFSPLPTTLDDIDKYGGVLAF